jgi:hypothetical protein
MTALSCGVGGSAIDLSATGAYGTEPKPAMPQSTLKEQESKKIFQEMPQASSFCSGKKGCTQDSINLSFQIEGLSYSSTGVFDHHLGPAQFRLEGRKVILASGHKGDGRTNDMGRRRANVLHSCTKVPSRAWWEFESLSLQQAEVIRSGCEVNC